MKHIKTLLATVLLLAVAHVAWAQLVTNQATIVLTQEQFSLLQQGWRVNMYERTNAGLPAVTFRVWSEEIAAAALVERASEIQAQREAKLLELFRAADDAKQIAILREALRE